MAKQQRKNDDKTQVRPEDIAAPLTQEEAENAFEKVEKVEETGEDKPTNSEKEEEDREQGVKADEPKPEAKPEPKPEAKSQAKPSAANLEYIAKHRKEPISALAEATGLSEDAVEKAMADLPPPPDDNPFGVVVMDGKMSDAVDELNRSRVGSTPMGNDVAKISELVSRKKS